MTGIPMLPLTADRRRDLIEHFSALPDDDLRLRFGHVLSGAAIDAYVDDIDFGADGVFGVFDGDLRLIGTAHVARLRRVAEFGVSVLPSWRGHGVGAALFARAITFARNYRLGTLYVHCQADNEPMLRIVRRASMRLTRASDEMDAWLALRPGDATTLAAACVHDQAALFDYAVKSQFLAARTLAGAFSAASRRLSNLDR